MAVAGVSMEGKSQSGPDLVLTESVKRKQIPQDIISQLPNDVLLSIISQHSLKEAFATSVLSSRWAQIGQSPSHLNFEASKTLDDKYMRLQEVERVKYVKWVNAVLRSHKGSLIEEFRVLCDLDKRHKHHIDSWLQFAFARSVKSLEVKLSRYEWLIPRIEEFYTFPSEILPKSGDIGSDAQPVFKYLKVLSFTSVDVSNEVLNFFLSNSPCLEHLAVQNSNILEDFEISDPSFMLKYLEISCCREMKAIKVCNVNLASLVVFGPSVLVDIHNLPFLVDVSVGFIDSMSDAFPALSCCLSQLEVLTLRTSLIMDWEMRLQPMLPKLKMLKLHVDATYNASFLGCATLLKAAPYLEKFVLQLEWYGTSREGKLNRIPCFSHEGLKFVKFAGYFGRSSDIEFVRFILRTAVSLEEFVVDTRNQFYLSHDVPMSEREIEVEKEARKYALEQFPGKVPSKPKFLII